MREKMEKQKEKETKFSPSSSFSSSSSSTGMYSFIRHHSFISRWGSIFQSPLPSLGSSRSNQMSSSTKPMVEEETFWDIVKKKSEKQQDVKNRMEKKESLSPRSNTITREEFDMWCREEMIALSGSDDISLLDFCISLEDAEVLSYLQDYLGQSKSVVNFAKAFNKKRQFINQ